MKKAGQALLLAITLILCVQGYGQASNDKVNSMKSMYKVKGDIDKDEKEELSAAGAQASIYLRVELKTTTDISKLKVKILNVADGSEVMNYSYNWEVTTGLPTDYSYQRDGSNLLLGLGKHAVQEYDITLEVEDNAAQTTLPLQIRIYPN